MTKLRRGPVYARALLEEIGHGAIELQRVASTLNLEIREVDAEGFDGALVRAWGLPLGAIAIRESIRETSRKNFTIAHEIGHFLLPGHGEAEPACTPSDVGNWGDTSKLLECEADEFAAELLMPASTVRPLVRASPPSLEVIEGIARKSHSSLSAAAWRYSELAAEGCAVVWSTDHQIRWWRRSRSFGFRPSEGTHIREGTFAFACFAGAKAPKKPQPVAADLWIGSGDLRARAKIWEQSKALPSYHSVISLLWIKDRVARG